MNIHHIAIASKDPENLSLFYENILGLVRIRTNFEASTVRSVWLQAGSSIIMIERCENDSRTTDAFLYKKSGFHLLAFSISPGERIRLKENLLNHSIAIEAESDFSIYFFDPEGNRLAFSHYPENI